MKKSIILAVSFISLIALAFIPPKKSIIIGHWQVVMPDTTKLFVDFTRDGSFKNYVSDGTIIFQGKYKLNRDTFSIYDKGCGINYPGKYKLTFDGENSIFFAVIKDSCSGRRGDIDGSTIKRVMKK